MTEVVGSYEEILFVVNAITAFLEPDLNPDHHGVDGDYDDSGGEVEWDHHESDPEHGPNRHGESKAPSPPPPPTSPPPLETNSSKSPDRRGMFRRRSSLMAGSWGGRKGSIRLPVTHNVDGGGGIGDKNSGDGANRSVREGGLGTGQLTGSISAKDIHIDTGSGTESDHLETKYDSDGGESSGSSASSSSGSNQDGPRMGRDAGEAGRRMEDELVSSGLERVLIPIRPSTTITINMHKFRAGDIIHKTKSQRRRRQPSDKSIIVYNFMVSSSI